MKRIVVSTLIVSVLVLLSGCTLHRAVNMAKCNFDFEKITGITWGGINFMKVGTNFQNLDASTVTSCLSALTSKDFALHVDMNMRATNPTKSAAGLYGFDYIVYYGDAMVGTGESTNQTDINIPGGTSTTIPLNFTLSCKDLVDVKHPVTTVEKIVGLIRDLSKIGKEDTDFVIKIRPHVRMGGRVVKGSYLKIGGK